jgi:Mn-dependent DtxR family transcriptional regulator
MKKPLDTKILEKLSERVERLCRVINDPNAAPMGKDWQWAELTNEALPELETYLSEIH